MQNLKSYIIITIGQTKRKIERGTKMEKAKTFAGGERERATTLTNNNQAKKLALLSIYRASTKHESV